MRYGIFFQLAEICDIINLLSQLSEAIFFNTVRLSIKYVVSPHNTILDILLFDLYA